MSIRDEELVMTHCGKLGDLITALPVISWVSKNINDNIHLVLTKYYEKFDTFQKIEALMLLQPMIKKFSLVDFPVTREDCGGQPYKHNPNEYGISCKYFFNLGFRQHPGNTHRSVFQAQEYGFGVDWDYRINLGPIEKNDLVVCEKKLVDFGYIDGRVEVIDESKDILYNAKLMQNAKEAHVIQAGLFHLLDWANVPTFLHRRKNYGNYWHTYKDQIIDDVRLYSQKTPVFTEILYYGELKQLNKHRV